MVSDHLPPTPFAVGFVGLGYPPHSVKDTLFWRVQILMPYFRAYHTEIRTDVMNSPLCLSGGGILLVKLLESQPQFPAAIVVHLRGDTLSLV